ncbi:Hypothetical protein FKW44_016791 [Caligus rogercresseyi]|uniref:Uncharacterized protein n=1 Tax=Caligus rogercresseyi TaxID=217165 RepID=A0A7T8H2E9_CALRO|nr:Hypothetical protein FKW44_016791 [Caligus rogercresseyi]
MGQANNLRTNKTVQKKEGRGEDKSNETPLQKEPGKNELGLPLQQQNIKNKRRFLYAEIAKEANELHCS